MANAVVMMLILTPTGYMTQSNFCASVICVRLGQNRMGGRGPGLIATFESDVCLGIIFI